MEHATRHDYYDAVYRHAVNLANTNNYQREIDEIPRPGGNLARSVAAFSDNMPKDPAMFVDATWQAYRVDVQTEFYSITLTGSTGDVTFSGNASDYAGLDEFLADPAFGGVYPRAVRIE